MVKTVVLFYEFDHEMELAYGQLHSTAEHLAALEHHGPCPLHRQSFAPVSQWGLFHAATAKERADGFSGAAALVPHH